MEKGVLRVCVRSVVSVFVGRNSLTYTHNTPFSSGALPNAAWVLPSDKGNILIQQLYLIADSINDTGNIIH